MPIRSFMKLIYQRYRWIVFAVWLLSMPVVFYAAQRARETNTNQVMDWLPESFEETQRLRWFLERFGSDELLMISWPGATLDDPRVVEFAERLRAPVTHEDGSTSPWFRKVFTGPEVLERLQSSPLELSTARAKARLQGWLLGDDGETTCLIALVSRAGMKDRRGAIEYVRSCAAGLDDLSPETIHVAGPTIESVAINDASQRGLRRMTVISLLLVLTLAYLCLRSLPLAFMVFGTAVFAQQCSMGFFYFTGTNMDSVSLMVPTLVYVLAISSGIHLVNYYREAFPEGGEDAAPWRAVHYAWRPCSLASFTTALGLISLLVSQLKPIRKFGTFASVGVLLGLAIVFILLPSLLRQFPQRRWVNRRTASEAARGRPRFSRLAELTTRYHLPISILGVLLFLVSGYGALGIQPTARLHDLFSDKQARVLQDYEWLESHIGPLVPIEVVLVMPNDNGDEMLERLYLVRRVMLAIQSIPAVDLAQSAVYFVPPLPSQEGDLRSISRRRTFNMRLGHEREGLAELGYLREDGDQELWRISSRVKSSGEHDYGQLMLDVRRKVAEVLGQQERVPGVSAVFSGSVPLVHKAQDQLLDDLFKSFLLAFVVIAITMIFLLRSISAGILSMVPNLLPSLLVFGVMGWMGVELEVGSMMTASAALGIAVDDTLHFVVWFRRGLSEGLSRKDAIRYAYRHCGTAMVQTSLVCGLGLLVFAASTFSPISRFAYLMAAMLGAALVGDLLVLPAMLSGPLGRFFEPKRTPPERTPPETRPQPETTPDS
jgi:predicted RND superfamily exporter protein